jgi:hypothetical protein
MAATLGDSISPYCGRHRIAFERYGDPHGFRLRRKRDYWHELVLVQAFLAKHREHAGVKAALSWLEKWLREDAHAVRLRGHAITPLAILTEAAALFLLSHWNANRLPAGTRLVFAIGSPRALLLLTLSL